MIVESLTPNNMKMKISPLALIVSLIIITAAITGLLVSGSPAKERLRQTDRERISDLEQMRYNVINLFYSNQDRLPTDLNEAFTVATINSAYLQDPETGEPYSYRPIDDRNYELCATFVLSSDDQENMISPNYVYNPGYTCFRFSVTPYPVEKDLLMETQMSAPVR